MGLAFKISIPELADDERGRMLLAKFAQHELNALARVNADWVLNEWETKPERMWPACCAKCGGVRYVPDRPNGETMPLEASPILLKRKVASCGSIAACHTGHKIAEAVMGKFKDPERGIVLPPMSWDEACMRIFVQLATGPDPKQPTWLHAVCNDAGTIIDPTKGMLR